MGDKTSSVQVKYKHTLDGWHVFNSDELPGLYVASQDAEAAYNDVATAIEKLLLLDEGVKCKIRPEVPFSQFLAFLRSAGHPVQKFLSQQRYTVLSEAS